MADARAKVFQQVNSELIRLYWNIGRLIVEDEQREPAGQPMAKQVLKQLSGQLTLEFGKGFDESNLKNMRIFYHAFPKRDALRQELSRTHYRILSRVENKQERIQYMHLAVNENWNTRETQMLT